MKDLLRLFALFRPYAGWLALGIVLALITLLANVALLAVSGWFITAMAIAGVAGVSMNYFTPSGLIRAAAIIRTAGRYGERLVTHEATFRLLAGLRVWFYQHLEPLAPARLEAYRSGDLLSRIRADIDTLDNAYLRLLVPSVVAILSSVVFVAVLAWYHPLLALVELTLLLVAGVFVPWLVNRLGHQSGERLIATQADLRARLVNDLQGMGELLVYGAAERHTAIIQDLSEDIAAKQRTLSHLNGISQGTLGLSANLAMWLVMLVSIPLVNEGTLQQPELAMLALFTLASFEAVMPLPLAFQMLGETLAAARRVFSLADLSPAVTEPMQPLPLPPRFDIRFDAVTFRYQAAYTDVLQGINLNWQHGQHIAVVGATGSGKSTLVQLLLKFREANTGAVLLNKQPLSAYYGEAWRTQIAVVPQQTHLFNTTIRDNLRLAHTGASDDELERVCRLAMIHDTIMAQPEGYGTYTGETGVRLSGGQAKRIAIARALLKEASLLILDEPTEGLDPKTAQQVMDNVLYHARECQQSVLLITHRLQGLEVMDQIIALDQGRIIDKPGVFKDN